MKHVAVMSLLAFAAPVAAQVVIPSGNGAVGTSVNVATLNTGTMLDVRGSVSADRRYVGVGIHVTQALLEGFDTYTQSGTAVSGGPVLATGITAIPFRPAQAGNVTFIAGGQKILGRNAPALKGQMSLREATRKLADETKSNIVLFGNALKAAKIDDKKAVSLDVPAGTVRSSLTALLKQALPDEPMVVNADDEVVYITTQANADVQVVTKVYFLADLLGNIPRFVPAGTDFGKLRPGNTADGSAGAKASTSIADIITSSVRPEIWKVNGGKIGDIRQVGERVSITAPLSVHALLDGPSHRPDPNARPRTIGYSTR